MNIEQITELLSLLREINVRLGRIEGIMQEAAMRPRISDASARHFAEQFVQPRHPWPPKPVSLGEIPAETADHILGVGAPNLRGREVP